MCSNRDTSVKSNLFYTGKYLLDRSQSDNINNPSNDQTESQNTPAEAQSTESMNSVKSASDDKPAGDSTDSAKPSIDKPPSNAELAPTTTSEKPDPVGLTDIDPEPATDGAEVFGIDTPGIERSKIG